MNWHSQTVVFCLWGVQPILQSVVAAIFWRRKLHRQFPAFFLFLLVQVANFAVTFPLWLMGSRTSYFWLFWLGEAVNAVLGFKVIHEIFLDVFRPYHTLKDLGTLLFKWAGVVLLLLSVVVAFSNSSDRDPQVHALTTLQRSVGVVQLGLILFLLLFSRFLGVSRKQVSFGIALGFGLFAGVDSDAHGFKFGGIYRAGQPEPDQHGDLEHGHFDLVRILALAQSAPPSHRQPFADSAMGTGPGGSSNPGGIRFADPHVRRHGGARVIAELESGASGRCSRTRRPISSTQGQLRCGRFQNPAIASPTQKQPPAENPVKRIFWLLPTLCSKPEAT